MKVVVLNEKFKGVLEVFRKVFKGKLGLQNISFSIQRSWDNEFHLVFRSWGRDDWFEGRVECFIKFEEGEVVDETWKGWKVVVNYFELLEALKQFSKKQTIILEKQENQLVLYSEKVRLFLNLAEEILEEPEFIAKAVSGFRLVFDSEDLVEAIRYVDFARDEKGDRDYTKGYYLDFIEINSDKVYLVTTDNHRLSWYRLVPKVKSGSVNIPGLSLSAEHSLILKTICQASQGVVDIQVEELDDKERVVLIFQAFPFVYKGIHYVIGFPDWLGLTPKEFSGSMIVEKEVAIEMIDFVKKGEKLTKSLAKERKSKGRIYGRVHLEFKKGEDKVKMEIWDNDISDRKVMERDFSCKWTGGDFLVAFDVRYLTEILSVLQDGFKIQFTHPSGIVQFEDLKKDCFVHWLMPMDLSKIPS